MAILANLFIDQGTDFSITVDVTDSNGEVLNMSGYSSAGQIRKTYDVFNSKCNIHYFYKCICWASYSIFK